MLNRAWTIALLIMPLWGGVSWVSEAEPLSVKLKELNKALPKTNARQVVIYPPAGNLKITGWAQESVQINSTLVYPQSSTESPEVGLSVLELPEAVEMRWVLQQGIDLLSKIKLKPEIGSAHNTIEIKMPSHKSCVVYGGSLSGNVVIERLHAGVEILGTKKSVRLYQVKSSHTARVVTQDGSIQVFSSETPLHAETKNGGIDLTDVKCKDCTLIAPQGKIVAVHIDGTVRISTQVSDVAISKMRGSLEVTAESGKVGVVDLDGGFQLETQRASLDLALVNVTQDSFIKADHTQVSLKLPTRFSGLIDLVGTIKPPVVLFPHKRIESRQGTVYGPTPPGDRFIAIGAKETPLIRIIHRGEVTRIDRNTAEGGL